MKVVDANVLLYAVNEDAPHHVSARAWLDGALSGRDTVGFSWIALLAFLRLATKSGLFPRPLPVAEALDRVDEWLSQPDAVLVHPTVRHSVVLRRLLDAAGVGGNLVNDGHLAALAVEHDAEVVSYDHDFSRFPGLVWSTPSVPR